MRLFLLLMCVSMGAWADQYVCQTGQGTADGTSEANCATAGTNYANITPIAGETIFICGTVYGTLTITSTNNVTVDACPIAGGEMTGFETVTAFGAADGDGHYTSTGTFTLPTFVVVDGEVWKHGATAAGLADNEWFFNRGAGVNTSPYSITLGSDPAGRAVQVATLNRIVGFASSNDGLVQNVTISGHRHTGVAGGNGAINFSQSLRGIVDGVTMFATRKCVDYDGLSSGTVKNITSRFSADCLDGNANGADTPTDLVFENNDISDVGYNLFNANVNTTHNITLDNEAIACTGCGSGWRARGNTITRSFKGITSRIGAAVTGHTVVGNLIIDTDDEAIDPGCLSGNTGVPDFSATGNIIIRAGSGAGASGSYHTSNYGFSSGVGACGNGWKVNFSNNVIVHSSNGWIIGGSASQTGTVTVSNNVVVGINPLSVSGTHYYANYNSVSATFAGTLTANNNRYFMPDGLVGHFRGTGSSIARTYASFASFQGDMSPNESASTLGDPQFAGGSDFADLLAAEDFKPASASPLCAAGTSLGSAQDYGNRRFKTPPAIGAWECARGSPRESVSARTSVNARTTVTAR